MSIAAPTCLSSFTLPSSLMGGETTDPDDDSDHNSTGKDSDGEDASCALEETSTDDHPSDEDLEGDNYDQARIPH